MTDLLSAILGWAVPVVVVFGVTAIAVAAGVWALRRARRSPRARAVADAERERAGVVLVQLDDAVEELDLEVGLSGALYGGGAPASLRRARLTAQHVRDESFEEYRGVTTETAAVGDVRRIAERIRRRATEALGVIEAARREHADWVRSHVSVPAQVDAARGRLARLQASMGDPDALVGTLAPYADAERKPATDAARAAVTAASEAGRLLDAAAAAAADPTRDALGDLARAERSLRAAEGEARALEEAHRLVTQAAQALPGEFDAARTALRQALTTREQLEPADADRLAGEIRAIDAELTALEPDAARLPTRTVDRIARLRDRLDLALGDARTAQQRLRGARSALPGTLAAARVAVAAAEASVSHAHAGADARARLGSAQRELAASRESADPVDALDAARRAMRDAEDARALADFARRYAP